MTPFLILLLVWQWGGGGGGAETQCWKLNMAKGPSNHHLVSYSGMFLRLPKQIGEADMLTTT